MPRLQGTPWGGFLSTEDFQALLLSEQSPDFPLWGRMDYFTHLANF